MYFSSQSHHDGNCLVASDDGSVASDHPAALPAFVTQRPSAATWEDSVVDKYMKTLQSSLVAQERDAARTVRTVAPRAPEPVMTSRGPLGELIIVRSTARPKSEEARFCPTPPEVAALQHEVDRLMSYCDVMRSEHQRALAALQEQTKAEVEKLVDGHLAESKARREEYTAAMVHLQEENSALRARVGQLEDETNSKELEAERLSLQRKLGDVEKAWSSLLMSKEQRWTEECRTHREAREKLEGQHKQLRDAVIDLEGALRRLVAEKERLEEIVQCEPQRFEQSSMQHAAELARARKDAQEARELAGALQEHVDLLERDALNRERVFEEKTLDLQREVENERQRNNGVVAMYVKQVDSLHQQLTSAMGKNRILVAELQKERARLALDQ